MKTSLWLRSGSSEELKRLPEKQNTFKNTKQTPDVRLKYSEASQQSISADQSQSSLELTSDLAVSDGTLHHTDGSLRACSALAVWLIQWLAWVSPAASNMKWRHISSRSSRSCAGEASVSRVGTDVLLSLMDSATHRITSICLCCLFSTYSEKGFKKNLPCEYVNTFYYKDCWTKMYFCSH